MIFVTHSGVVLVVRGKDEGCVRKHVVKKIGSSADDSHILSLSSKWGQLYWYCVRVQDGPGAHPTSCKMGSGSLFRG